MKREAFFRQDLRRFWVIRSHEKASWLRKVRLYLSDQGIRYVAAYRLRRFAGAYIKRNPVLGLPLFVVAFIAARFSSTIHNIHIESYDDLGPGLFIAHPSCIFIGGTIGRNCLLHQCTTIGWGYTGDKAGLPEIGDNVWIGPNVVITGRIRIGSNATIAAGAVVTKDVPDGALAMGNPARVVSADYDNRVLNARGENSAAP
jgi:serine O-acetyltransferase